jgi:hypothetical protein
MEERTVYSYVYFGTTLWYLRRVSAGARINGNGYVRDNLDAFLKSLKTLDLPVCEGLARTQGLTDLSPDLGTGKDAVLTAEQADAIQDAITVIRPALNVEASKRKAFIVSPKRWDVDRLLQAPSSMLGPGVFAQLDELAQFDFEEACRCLAFQRASAAAFHMMRCIEGMLRMLYCSVVMRKRLAKKDQTWGAMLKQLRGRSTPPPASLLDELDNIRNNYRNPTQHPDAKYDIHRAQDLLGICIGVVNQMVDVMAD